MKMLVIITLPAEPFNTMVIDGDAGEIIGKIVNETKPESIHFTEIEGNRGAFMVVDVPEASAIPSIAEPWYLNFEAFCEFKVAMTPDDLMKAKLNELGSKWQ